MQPAQWGSSRVHLEHQLRHLVPLSSGGTAGGSGVDGGGASVVHSPTPPQSMQPAQWGLSRVHLLHQLTHSVRRCSCAGGVTGSAGSAGGGGGGGGGSASVVHPRLSSQPMQPLQRGSSRVHLLQKLRHSISCGEAGGCGCAAGGGCAGGLGRAGGRTASQWLSSQMQSAHSAESIVHLEHQLEQDGSATRGTVGGCGCAGGLTASLPFFFFSFLVVRASCRRGGGGGGGSASVVHPRMSSQSMQPLQRGSSRVHLLQKLRHSISCGEAGGCGCAAGGGCAGGLGRAGGRTASQWLSSQMQSAHSAESIVHLEHQLEHVGALPTATSVCAVRLTRANEKRCDISCARRQ